MRRDAGDIPYANGQPRGAPESSADEVVTRPAAEAAASGADLVIPPRPLADYQ